MAKVGRAARVASRQRVEILGDADKTIQSAETGELYILTSDLTGLRTVTLPAPQDGAYFKFMVMALLDGASLKIKTHDAGTHFIGGLLHQDSDNTTANFVEEDGSGNADEILIKHDNDGTKFGSWVECVSDGTSWYVTGVIHADEAPTIS
ncbi:MAG: hypothetical protein GOVbin1807_93 [Prokaryotic dsDNA virus sp.]|nr:MAG: hypothetical protein GOVbin1807_93 [Prokaryotic dsDNA virus sp.]|tara:strand:- start:3368 stop:3817 length:450 start_codon:yes stop_codon:yes gene_type:complete